jgi:hypothetical protein
MTSAPKRRWFRYSLRMLFVVVTVIACWLGWNLHVVEERKLLRSWIQKNRGHVLPAADWMRYRPLNEPITIPLIRQWFGDEPIYSVSLPYGSSQFDLDRTRAAFSEARVQILPNAQGQGMM